jgi:hypothetical protein
MGGTRRTHGELRNACNLMRSNHIDDLGVDGRIILKLLLNRI